MESDSTPQLTRRELLDLAGVVLGGVSELAKRLPSNGHSLPSHYAILCYSTMLQDAAACFVLMQRSLWGPVQKMLRPIIESYMHLKNITHDDCYINEVLSEACESLERYVRPHEKKQISPELAMSDAEIVKCRDTISGYRRMISQEWKRKKVPEQYRDAGIESFFVYSYSKYSRSIHGNLLALLDSHTIDVKCLDIIATKEVQHLEFNTIVSEFVHMIQDATTVILSYCGVKLDEESEKYIRVCSACTSRIQDELRETMKATKC